MKYGCNYLVAVNWLGNHRILCNNITKVDDDLEFRFDYYNEEDDTYNDIYQYYLTDCTEQDVDFLEKHFDLLFCYSEKLDMYILCVDHYGTSWDYVYCETDLENAQCDLGQR